MRNMMMREMLLSVLALGLAIALSLAILIDRRPDCSWDTELWNGETCLPDDRHDLHEMDP
jgi:hypothetical protein